MIDLIASAYQNPVLGILGLSVAVIWETVWKGLGLWKAAQCQQRNWFIVILIVNSMGLLPIIYLIWFKNEAPSTKKTVKKIKT